MTRKTVIDKLYEKLGMRSEGATVAVVGLGITGISVVRFLKSLNFSVIVVDSRNEPPGHRELVLHYPEIPCFTGGFHDLQKFSVTHCVVSPGVALETTELAQLANSGIPMLGDIDLFACAANAPIIGITGSNGKSTVTSLVGTMAQHAGLRVAVGGNLGTAALDLLSDDIQLYVLELSSFQLERTHHLNCAAATVLNVSPDHMDRYPSCADYAAAKQRICLGAECLVLNADDPIVAGMASPDRSVAWFSLLSPNAEFHLVVHEGKEWLSYAAQRLIATDDLRLRGRHNLANALAALALGYAANLPHDAMVAALKEFSGLPHRMQWVAQHKGVTYINDSKATNVGATQAALAGLEGKAILIAGGDGKGQDFSPLADAAAHCVRNAILIGKDAVQLFAVLHPVVSTVCVESLREAVAVASALAQPGDTVLLAPACASLDQFRDYQERGQIFADAVRELAA